MQINQSTIHKALVGLIVLTVLVSLYIYRGSILSSNSTEIVTFDMHKFLNSQRVVTNELLGKKTGESDILYMQKLVSEQVKPLILEIANGAKVMSKQAFIIDGSVPDITDEVLNRLGLPTDVSGHNAILINSIDKIEKEWKGWKPNLNSNNDLDEPTQSPLDMLP